jgi:hypothetical protein
MMDILAIINNMPVVESSASGGELEFVYVEDSPENVQTLRRIGVVGQIEADDGVIDISIYAFAEGKAKWFEPSLGFVNYVPDYAPEWAK